MSTSSSKKDIETLLGPIERLPGNIAVVRVLDNMHVDMGVMVDLIDGMLRCFPREKFFVIADARKIATNVTIDALTYCTSNTGLKKYCAAGAIVTDSLSISLIANYYANTLARQQQVKVFKYMSDAKSWIHGKAGLLKS